MMPRARQSNSSVLRRHNLADRLLVSCLPAMHPCASCVRFNQACLTSPTAERCEQCVRFHRSCDLAPPYTELDRLDKKEDDLSQQILEAEARVRRLRRERQRVHLQQRQLVKQEEQNVEEKEWDELLSEDLPTSFGEALVGITSPTGASPASWGSLDRTPPAFFGSA
jgi:TolA-binding protein